MKLFQRLLVAPAALGLMAPVAANADSAFSPVTNITGTAYFTVGSVADGGTSDNQEELYMQYAYEIDLTSSFVEGQTLYAGIEAGNASGPFTEMDSAVEGGSSLNLASLYYNFEVGDLDITAGPLLDQDDVLAAETTRYPGTFRLSAMPFSEAGDETGPGVAVSYGNDNGVVASASLISLGGADSTKGISADDADDVSTFTLGYNDESGNWGGGLVLASNDGEGGTTGYDTFGGGIYYSPESIDATLSVAYDTTDPETGADKTDLFVGVVYEGFGPGKLNAAYNSTDVDGNEALDSTGFEVSYTYSVNDFVTVTPGFFTVEDTSTGDDDTGVLVETVFSF